MARSGYDWGHMRRLVSFNTPDPIERAAALERIDEAETRERAAIAAANAPRKSAELWAEQKRIALQTGKPQHVIDAIDRYAAEDAAASNAPAFVESPAEGAHIMTPARRKALAKKLGGRIK